MILSSRRLLSTAPTSLYHTVMGHHAYVIAGDSEMGIQTALTFIEREFGMNAQGNPDVVALHYSLLSVENVRKVIAAAQQGPLLGEHKTILIVASRIYHEAQNALLKLFEDPPKGTTLFLILPELGQLLPTLRSRIAVLESEASRSRSKPKGASDGAEQFITMSLERRRGVIKKLVSAVDEESRQSTRDEALALVNGIEAIAYKKWGRDSRLTDLLIDIAQLRGYLYDRSAPLKMILEHLALTIPKGLAK